MNQCNDLKLIYEEKFETDLHLGEWYVAEHPYKESWTPFDVQTGSRNPFNTKKCYLTPTNALVHNGCLTMFATEQDDGYYGVELRTNKYYSYGYFEIDAKINASRGICPAFWLVGNRDSASKIEYEIDGFECFGETPDVIKHTLLAHSYPNGPHMPKAETAHRFECYERLTEDLSPMAAHDSFFRGKWSEDFHKFAVDWKPGQITWLVDGKPVYRVDTSQSLEGRYPFNEPLQVILTIYSGVDVCSPRTGIPDETTDWKTGNSLVIRSIRFYEYDIQGKLQ